MKKAATRPPQAATMLIIALTEAQHDAEAYQQQLSRLEAARDDWLRFLS